MNKWMYRLSILTVAIAQIFIVIVAYWSLYPYSPITYVEPVPVARTVFQTGESVEYTIDYCWKGEYPVAISRRLIGQVEYPYETVHTKSTNGCYNTTLQTPPIPPNMPAGEYRIRFIGEYKVNPIRTINVTLYSETFNIE